MEVLRSRSAPHAETIRLLLVADDSGYDEIVPMLHKYDLVRFEIEPARSPAECLEAIAGHRFDLLLLDESMPGGGLDLIHRLSENRDSPPIIMLIATPDEATLRAMDPSACYTILKDSTDYLVLGRAVHQMLLRHHRQAEENRARAELERLTVVDGLTSLHNERYLIESLEAECRRARRYGSPLSFLLVDMDDFKFSNDLYGQRAGDHILKQVALLIGRSVRETDIAARFDRKEFGVLLPETGFDGAMQLAERLRFAVAAQRLAPDDKSEPMTISVGVFTPKLMEELTSDVVIARAEEALQEAKTSGKNKVCGRRPDRESHPA